MIPISSDSASQARSSSLSSPSSLPSGTYGKGEASDSGDEDNIQLRTQSTSMLHRYYLEYRVRAMSSSVFRMIEREIMGERKYIYWIRVHLYYTQGRERGEKIIPRERGERKSIIFV